MLSWLKRLHRIEEMVARHERQLNILKERVQNLERSMESLVVSAGTLGKAVNMLTDSVTKKSHLED